MKTLVEVVDHRVGRAEGEPRAGRSPRGVSPFWLPPSALCPRDLEYVSPSQPSLFPYRCPLWT